MRRKLELVLVGEFSNVRAKGITHERQMRSWYNSILVNDSVERLKVSYILLVEKASHTDCKEPWMHKCLPWLHAAFSLVGVLRRTSRFFLRSCWLHFLCLFKFWGSMKIITSQKQARQAYFLHTNSEGHQDSPQSANKSAQCGWKVSIKILSPLTR